MPDAREIVNKALDGDENPSTYVDWLGKKTEVGEIGGVRFGIHIHTTDEDVIAINAKEAGVETDSKFWETIGSDIRWLEENAAVIAREFGLYIQGEGHGDSGEYVGSAWVSATANPTTAKGLPLRPTQIAIAKKLVELGSDMPSTSDGSFWTFFPGSESKLYKDVSEWGRQFLDVTVEFTGTEALAEWLKLNVVESTDADDPESFVKTFVPRLKGKLVIDYCLAVTGCKDSVYDNVDGLHLVRYEPKAAMARMAADLRSREALGAKDKAYRIRVEPPWRSSLTQEWLKQINISPEDWAKVSDPNSSALMYFYTTKQEFNNYLRYVYPQIKLRESEDVDSPEGYLDKVTGWIDTFLNAGMTRDASAEHTDQFWKKYECDGTNYWIYLHVRSPLWLLVVRTDAATGKQQLSIASTFVDKDHKGMVTHFTALDRLLTKCRTRARGDWANVDAEIVDMENQNERDRKLKLSGKRPMESVDEPDPQKYLDQIHDLADLTHEIQNYGMFVNRIHPWGRWVVLSGGAYWATLHGRDDEEPLKADFFQAKLDEFMKKLGITQYHIKIGQTGTNNEHVWYQLGIPKAQLDQESWQPFIRNTSWPESSTDIAKWLPESTDPDDPSVNVNRHVAAMDPEKILVPLGFSKREPSWQSADPDYHWWEMFDHKTGFRWTVIRKGEDAPHIMEVSILRMERLPERPFSEWKQIGGFKTHVGNLAANIKKARRLKWYTPGNDLTWHKNVQKLQTQNESQQPVQEGAEDITDWTEFLDIVVETGHLSRRDAIRYQQRHVPEIDEQIYALFIEMDEASQNGDATEVTAKLQHIARLVKVQNMRYGSAIKDVMRDLPVDESEGDPEEYIKQVPIKVKAEITGDHGGPMLTFDAGPYFDHLAREDNLNAMLELAKVEFQTSYAADDVARYFSDTTLKDFWATHITDGSGFEVFVDEKDVKHWVEHVKPEWFPYLWPNEHLIESVDDPNPQFMQDTFDVPTILKRMGYEQHSPASPWFKVFNRMPVGLDYMIEVQRRGLGGEQNEADVVYDTTLYHYPVSANVKREWSPIAHRYKRNNKQLEPMLKALEARIKANNLRGIVGDPDAAANPEFDDFVAESVDDPDDPSTTIAAHTQDLVADPDEPVKLNKHPHGEAEAELEVLGFKPSWIAGKNTIYGEPEIPNFWSKAYRGPGSSKVLFLKIIPDKTGAAVSVRTRSMSIPVTLKPRSMAHIVTIIKDVDAAVQRAAENNLTKAQEIDAIVSVLDHHRQWCQPS